MHLADVGVAACEPLAAPTPSKALVNDHQVIKDLPTATCERSERDSQSDPRSAQGLADDSQRNRRKFVYSALVIVSGKQSESEHLFHETAEADTVVFELDMALESR